MERRKVLFPAQGDDDLLEFSDHLAHRSDEAIKESNQLSRHFATLSAESEKLLEHCRALCARVKGRAGREK